MSAITGESVPREVEPGNEILSGTINKNGLLTVEVTKEFGDSTVSKILELVQNANSRKAPTEQTFSDWIYRALVFLVVSCPCALVISIPLGFFGGIGGDTIVFDKTGTLTKGVFKVTKIHTLGRESEENLLEYAAFAESYSSHPIATSILKAYGKEINKSEIENYDEISGHGIKVSVKGKQILAGNNKLMLKEKITYDVIDESGTVVHIE